MFQDIVTDRLILRRLTPADAEAVLQYRSDPEVARYQSWELDSVARGRKEVKRLAYLAFAGVGAR